MFLLLNFAEQFAARQREKEIASKGFSSIKTPKKMTRLKKLPKDMVRVKASVEALIAEQDNLLRGISNRIHHRAQLALRRLKYKDTGFALSAMRSIVEQQHEYIQISILKRALQVYLLNIACGLASSKNAKKDMKAIRHAHSSAKKPEIPQYSEEMLLTRLQHKYLFPLIHFNEGSAYHVVYSDTPPFCNQDVAQERAKEIASRGFSKINLPTGYVRREKPTSRMVPAIRLVKLCIQEQEAALSKLIFRIQEIAQGAIRHALEDRIEDAATEMRAIRELQYAFLHHSQVIEGVKAYEDHLMHDLMDVSNAKQDLDDIKSIPPRYRPTEETETELLTYLNDRKFFPRLFPLLGGGVKVHFSASPPIITTKRTWDNRSMATQSTETKTGE